MKEPRAENTAVTAELKESGLSPPLEVRREGNGPTKQGHNNAFDLMRLVLALLVVYTHAYLLGGFGREGFGQFARGQATAGTMAVLGFFGISGFLVTRSFVTRDSWRLFIKARLLRILPGLYFSLLCSAFIFAPIISSLNPRSGGWRFAAAAGFVGRNALVAVKQWNVGDILANLPYSGSLNGALWSLFPELCCYGLVFALGIAGAIRNRANLIAGFVMLLVLHVALILAPRQDNLAPTLLALTGWTPYVTAFFVGMLAYSFRDNLNLGGRQALLWSAVVLIVLKFGGWSLLGPIVLPLALIHAAHAVHIEIPADFSYGVYILHFPILQTLSAAGANRAGFFAYLALGTTIALLCSALSWYWVESPMLKLKQAR